VSRVDCRDWTLVVTDRVLQVNPAVPGHLVLIEERQFVPASFRYDLWPPWTLS
jgi:hypothetical protein